MTTSAGQTAFLLMWIGFTALVLIAISAVLVWAVRNRQFSDQDRARYLPLQSNIPGKEEEREKTVVPPATNVRPTDDQPENEKHVSS